LAAKRPVRVSAPADLRSEPAERRAVHQSGVVFSRHADLRGG
jgi:hypothetical protein